MAKYSCSSSAQYFSLLRQDILNAFNGKLYIGDSETGERVFEDASREQCLAELESCVDEIVHHAIRSNASGVALERLFGPVPEDFVSIMKYGDAVDSEYNKWWAVYKPDDEGMRCFDD